MAGTLATVFARMSHAEIRARVEVILKSLIPLLPSLEPWSPFIATVAQLQEVFRRFTEADDAAQTGNFLSVAQRNAIRPELNQVVTEIGDYIELGARKDPGLLIKTGYEGVRPAKRATPSSRGPLDAPANLTLRHGKERGTLLARLTRVPGAKSYEIHINLSDPTVESNWKYFGVSGTCTMEMRGFDPGKNVSARARAVGSNSTGPWSRPVTIMPV